MFALQLEGLNRAEIREWYNGYAWRGEERVYNPFDILLLFDSREFKAHWFETCTPSFLLYTLVSRGLRLFDFDGMLVSEMQLSKFDVGEVCPEALLFQTGYLTFVAEERLGKRMFYRLGFPDREVRLGLNDSLASYLVNNESKRIELSQNLYHLLFDNDIDGMRDLFHAFFSSVPNEWYMNNNISNYEDFYASVFFTYFTSLELDVIAEDTDSQGRLDMAVRFQDRAYVFEFKVIEQSDDGTAMAQLQARGFADKVRANASAVYLVAVEFSSASRNIESFAYELA